MKIEDIIESLNQHIEDKRQDLKCETRGHLILQKNITSNQTFKAYKVINYILWFVKDKVKYKVLHIECTARLLDENKDRVFKEIELNVIRNLFNLVKSDIYNDIICGTVNRENNEIIKI